MHSVAAHTVLPCWDSTFEEAWFCAGKGIAVVFEEGVMMAVVRYRRQKQKQKQQGIGNGKDVAGLERWDDR